LTLFLQFLKSRDLRLGLKGNNNKKKAKFLAASALHSGDWLLARPIASCELRLDDEAIRVAVALRISLDLGVPHA